MSLGNGIEIATWIVTAIFVISIFKMILPAKGVKQLTKQELLTSLEAGDVQLIDVRPAVLYNHSHVQGFENMPLKVLKEAADTLDKEKAVVVICQTGTKGNVACKRLKRKGFRNLANVKGGLSGWNQA